LVDGIAESIDRVAAATGFAGVVRVDRRGREPFVRAYGLAHRGSRLENTVGTRFGIASGTKGLTALAVMRLVEDGVLDLGTTARSLLGKDLPLVDDRVTVEHLLAHRSGIGDYLAEAPGGSPTGYVLPVPVHRLAETRDYLAVLGGHPQVFAPGERFAYSNSGFVILALVAERATGSSFRRLVAELVCGPAGMAGTGFPRSDEPDGLAALGYLERDGPRTNVLHLPVRGSGDGGAYSTATDVTALWQALFAGRIVPAGRVAEMVRPRSDVPGERKRYGLGFWLHPRSRAVALEGYDAGVSFRSVCDPDAGIIHTVISNWTDGAWPLARHLRDRLTPEPAGEC
jgi:CubicO group peptidase (beta-lactamase class C family)